MLLQVSIMNSTMKNFTIAGGRPLPVILIVDISGSMNTAGKMLAVNQAVAEMLRSFEEEDSEYVEIRVAIITFGNKEAVLHQDLLPASQARWVEMKAAGQTPMGSAFTLAQQLIEDKQRIPSRAYAPSIVLISDGVPTDDWETALKALLASERAAKAARFALAIGDDAQIEMLQTFLQDKNGKVFQAHEAADISKFFRWVTMSVSTRSQSNNPNQIEINEPDDFEY
jgi:uncharacterized protein YegL